MNYNELCTELISNKKVLEFGINIIDSDPKFLADPESKQEFINKLPIQKIRELLDEASKYTKQIPLSKNPFHSSGIPQIIESLCFATNENNNPIFSQSILAETAKVNNWANNMLYQQDPMHEKEMSFQKSSESVQHLPVQDLLSICEQVSKIIKKLETLNIEFIAESIIRALDDLISFVDDTYERFYNENRRFQVLARIRKVLREQLFDYLPTGSVGKRLVTAIINATNRTTAKNFRKKYLNIFKDSLEALRDGRTDAETMINLEKKLLEVDDEL
jgi:hypothetical protein